MQSKLFEASGHEGWCNVQSAEYLKNAEKANRACNYKEAFKWYWKAAVIGSMEGQFALGNCYCWGKGVERAYTEAIKWYEKAAEQGNIKAQQAIKWIKEQNQTKQVRQEGEIQLREQREQEERERALYEQKERELKERELREQREKKEKRERELREIRE